MSTKDTVLKPRALDLWFSRVMPLYLCVMNVKDERDQTARAKQKSQFAVITKRTLNPEMNGTILSE